MSRLAACLLLLCWQAASAINLCHNKLQILSPVNTFIRGRWLGHATVEHKEPCSLDVLQNQPAAWVEAGCPSVFAPDNTLDPVFVRVITMLAENFPHNYPYTYVGGRGTGTPEGDTKKRTELLKAIEAAVDNDPRFTGENLKTFAKSAVPMMWGAVGYEGPGFQNDEAQMQTCDKWKHCTLSDKCARLAESFQNGFFANVPSALKSLSTWPTAFVSMSGHQPLVSDAIMETLIDNVDELAISSAWGKLPHTQAILDATTAIVQSNRSLQHRFVTCWEYVVHSERNVAALCSRSQLWKNLGCPSEHCDRICPADWTTKVSVVTALIGLGAKEDMQRPKP